MLMIDGKNGHVKIVGTSTDLLAEMTTLIHTMYERFCEACDDREVTAELFKDCFDHALMSDEEIVDEYTDDIWKRMVGDDNG